MAPKGQYMEMVTRQALRKRAQRTIDTTGPIIKACVICGTTKKIHRHHIDEDITNNDVWNLTYICEEHHIILHNGVLTYD